MKKWEQWLTEVCLDIYDWYTKQIAYMQQELLDAKKLHSPSDRSSTR